MNVIFLDIDGVLNNMRFAEQHYTRTGRPLTTNISAIELDDFTVETVAWDPQCVAALWHIINETDAKIVISSTWRRFFKMVTIRGCFTAYPPEGEIPMIIDRTETLDEVTDRDGTVRRAIRGDEINDWLERNIRWPRARFGPPEAWVSLDDDRDFHPENNLIHVDNSVGLTMEDAERAIAEIRRQQR
jgi:hypothetical protein